MTQLQLLQTAKVFWKWYGRTVEEPRGEATNHYPGTTPQLAAWYRDMLGLYPALNGPDASPDTGSLKIADHDFYQKAIFADFRWPEAENARRISFLLAAKHNLGFFDLSEAEGGVWLPTPSGNYVWAHGDSVGQEMMYDR